MILTNRAQFNDLASNATRAFKKLSDGSGWTISIGMSECSFSKGARETHAELKAAVDSGAFNATLRQVGCGGWCWAEPFLTVTGPGHPAILYANVTRADVPDLLASLERGEVLERLALGVFEDAPLNDVPSLFDDPFFGKQHRILLSECGFIDPTSIEEYIANGGYAAWTKALFDMSPEEVIEEVKIANVRGRGGAGFPAGIKWESGRRTQAWPKYVACNSHEGEPNVYKDRRIIESNPHMILEGIMLGCYGVGAERGYNYVGGEHILAVERFKHAVAQAYEYGLLGENVLGTGLTFHVRTRVGGGAYICGEGSAMMYSVMGERGQPRTKPPRSVEEGLWRRPTVLNNTETMASVPSIIRNGGEWYAGIGNEKSTGTKLITMQGPLKRLGLVEVEMGSPLRDVIFDMYGGMEEGKTFKGVQTGGVSAGPLVESQLDVGLDFDSMKPYNAMLGSGGFVVFDESVDAVEFARYLMSFNRYESCGKCTPCRLGNPALVEIVDRILSGNGRLSDLALIENTAKHVIGLSLCGLGQVAPVPLQGMIEHFREDFVSKMIDFAGDVDARSDELVHAAGD
jgi:NADH:ubiquinone oxidoreductase subunit F (NADH-binding)/(2Fe-2S) ferredoxin